MGCLTLILALCATPEDGLIEKLGNDDFDVREQATMALQEKMDGRLYMRLKEMRYNDNGDAEIQYRVRCIVKRYENKITVKNREPAEDINENTIQFFLGISEAISDFFQP